MDTHDILKTVVEVSVLGGICWVFVQSMLKRATASNAAAVAREERISGRVTQLELFVEKELIAIIRHNGNALGITSKSLQANTAALERTSMALEKAEHIAMTAQITTQKLIERMEQNPCLIGPKLREEQAKFLAIEVAEQLRTTDQ